MKQLRQINETLCILVFKDELAVDREQGCKVPITLLESLTNFLGKKSSKRLDQAKGALTLWLSGILIKTLPATTDAACGKDNFLFFLYEGCLENPNSK